MFRTGFLVGSGVVAVLMALLAPVNAYSQPAAPDLQEVYGVIRAHLEGITAEELNRTAVQALVSALAPRVSLSGQSSDDASQGAPLVSKVVMFDPQLAYLRVARVTDGLAASLREKLEQFQRTNRLTGVVLDLRFGLGEDYGAAVAAADLFIKKDVALLDWGQGVVRSKPQENAVTVPVAVLMNRQTSGSAEALAAVLREASVALLLGGQTAGQAMIWQEYPLTNGSRLRIASSPVMLADGARIPADGVKPDIAVDVSLQDERVYFTNAYQELLSASSSVSSNQISGSQSNAAARARRPRINEAELVRARREGLSLDADGVAPEAAVSDQPVIRDPVLVRALDVLKGLALVQRPRP